MSDKITEPGIYFGLAEEDYFAIEALSASGMKYLRMSPLDFWSRSWMNNLRDEDLGDESDAKVLGKAYHARILEGSDAFNSRFAADLDPSDFPEALHTAEQIKSRIREINEDADVKVKLSGTKDELAARLIEIDPRVKLWDAICDAYAKRHPGKEFIAQRLIDKIEFAVRMIESKPDLKHDFKDGMPEVTVVYRCPDTEVLCKLRMDYLKPHGIRDLKSFSNTQERPIRDAIMREFANRRMAFQAAWYVDGARFIAPHVKAGRVFGDVDQSFLKQLAANHKKTFKFVFVQKGPAPLARGWEFPDALSTFQIAKTRNDTMKQLFRECLDAYPEGAPWVDAVGTEAFTDDEMPLYATD